MNEKIRRKIEHIIYIFSNTPLYSIIIGLIILGKTILFYNNTVAIRDPIEINTIVGTLIFIAAIVCFECILPQKLRKIITTIINFLISILIFSDELYYTYSSSFISVAQISNIQYGRQIIQTIPTLVKLKQILYFIDLILVIILLIIGKINRFENKQKEEDSKRKERSFLFEFINPKAHLYKILISIMISIIAIILLIIFGVKFISKGNSTLYNKDIQMRTTTIFGYHIYDIYNVINTKSKTKYKTYDSMIKDYNGLKKEYNEKYGELQYDFQGILENKNIIILQVEALQQFIVNKKINGTEITPNFNKFLSENIEFTNMHMQSYSTTADSEHSTISSLYPLENGMAFSKYYTNTYDDIFKIFNKSNYYTSYMHGNYPYFWNRGNVYGRLNIDDLSLKEQFEDLSENINGDLSDELLYRQAVQKLKNFDSPFISYIVTASSHTPYTLEGLQDKNKISVDVGEYKDTVFGNFIESINYADYAFGVFLEELKNEGLYEKTAILVFGDHNGLSMYEEEMVDYLNEKNKLSDIDLKLNYTSLYCAFKIPGVQNIKINKMINKLDIKPTLAYLCNIKDNFSLGTNMFGNKDFVCLNNERIITNKYYFDEQWFDISTGEEIDIEKTNNEIKNLLNNYYRYMKTELDISNSVIINNLLY